MNLTKDQIKKIFFLTRTSISERRIKNLAVYMEDFEALIDRINHLNYTDLDRDWTLYDLEYKQGKSVYAKNIKVIDEKDIFKGTHIHRCKTGHKLLIQLIGNSGYCRRCDTQFIPKTWWDHPLKDSVDYNEIKYGLNIPKAPFKIEDGYQNKLKRINVDKRILNKACSAVHSPIEIEKILNTKYYDWNNPPLPSKIHSKLLMLYKLWSTRPVLILGIYPDSAYFFHKCKNNIERILFEEKYFLPWCPSCFTKFIPSYDLKTIEKYKEYITIKGYSYDIKNENKKYINEETKLITIHKDSNEYYYLSALGLEDRCSVEEVNYAFRKMSKIYHPDFGGDSEMFQKIVKAKNWLYKYYKNTLISRNL